MVCSPNPIVLWPACASTTSPKFQPLQHDPPSRSFWRHARAAPDTANAWFLDPFGTYPRNQERFVFFQIGANKVMILPPALAAEDIVADTIENSVAIACRRHKPNVSEKLRYRHGKKRLEIDVAVREGQEIVVFEAMAKILTAASRAGHMMKFLDDYTNSFLALLRQLVPYDGHIKLGQSLLTGHDNDSAALRVTKIAVSPLSFGPASDHRQRRQKTGL